MNGALDEEAARENEMLRSLREAGFKMTPQRAAIVKLFSRETSHPTAQSLFERLRPDFPTMSFATVYNTLDALAKSGQSGTLRLGHAARFDPNTRPHHHAVCRVCSAVFDIPVATQSAGEAEAKRVEHEAPGFRVDHVELYFRGTCAACRQ
ncbi:MAG: Fur family transcriptional regulator [Polyangiaceae bacterium]